VNKTKTAILSISLLNILMNAGIVPIFSTISAVFPDASPTMLKLTCQFPPYSASFSACRPDTWTAIFPRKCCSLWV
jgi:hypothetical protein